MPVTDLVFPSYKLDPQSLSGLKEKEGQIFQSFSGVEGLEKAFRGIVLEENGVGVDPKGMRSVLVLEWANSSSFHSFFPNSPKFEGFVKTIKPFVAAPAIPELYAARDRSVSCTSSSFTQIIKIKFNETTEQVWKGLEESVTQSLPGKANFYCAKGLEKDEGIFLGLIGWKEWQEYQQFGKGNSFLDLVKALNPDEKAQNIMTQLTLLNAV